MKSSKLLSLAVVAMLCVAPQSLPLHAAESSPTATAHQGLSTNARVKFLNDAEASLHSSAKVSSDFWGWLKKHPQVRAGLLTAADPVPAVYVENLDHLRTALGPVAADRYANLLLGVSLTDQLQPTTATGGDGAYNASAFGSTVETTDSQVNKIAAYLKSKNITLQAFVEQMDSILASAGVPVVKGKEKGSLVDNVAFATRTYPPRIEYPLVSCLKKLIARYQTQVGPFADKGPQWPLFPIDSAPFPLLAPLRQTLPERELDYLWDRFNGKIAGAKDRLPTYGHYTFDYEKPEIKYKQSDWNPTSLPRIVEDGGVCGRLSTLAQLAAVGLGRPAVGMYQPGHRALLTYHKDPRTGHYVASMDQSITTPDVSTNQWFMPAPHGLRVNENGKVVSVEWHMALTLSMNLGIERYIDSRICVFLAARPTVSASSKLDLLQSAVDENPYNLEAWYAWADTLGTNTAAANALLARMDSLLFNPNSGMSNERELSANTDLNAHLTTETPDVQKQSNLVASMAGDAIAESIYKAALADKSNAAKNLSNLQSEIARRAGAKLPHGAGVTALVDSYSMLTGGASATQEQVTEEVKRLSAEVTGKQRKKEIDAVEPRVEAVAKGMSTPLEAAKWLRDLYEAFPEANRFKTNAEGKAEADPLYQFLHNQLVQSLRGSGKSGAAQIQQINADFESAKASAK